MLTILGLVIFWALQEAVHFPDQRGSSIDAIGRSYVKGKSTESETVGKTKIWVPQHTYPLQYSTHSHNSLNLYYEHTMNGRSSWTIQKYSDIKLQSKQRQTNKSKILLDSSQN